MFCSAVPLKTLPSENIKITLQQRLSNSEALPRLLWSDNVILEIPRLTLLPEAFWVASILLGKPGARASKALIEMTLHTDTKAYVLDQFSKSELNSFSISGDSHLKKGMHRLNTVFIPWNRV